MPLFKTLIFRQIKEDRDEARPFSIHRTCGFMSGSWVSMVSQRDKLAPGEEGFSLDKKDDSIFPVGRLFHVVLDQRADQVGGFSFLTPFQPFIVIPM